MSTNITRRGFLKISGGLAATAALGPVVIQVLGAPAEQPDLIFRNGPIITMADRMPVAEAIAIRGESIMAVGADREITQLARPQTKVIDLKGRSLSPGLIDAHSHPIPFGHMELRFVILRPPEIDSFDTLGRKLAAAAAKLPKGEWIMGRGFNEFKERRFPRRQELDKYVPDHPVLIIHWGGQMGVANTMAMKTADLLRADVADPYGGKFLRSKADNLPDGVLLHYPAIYAVHEDRLTDQDYEQCAKFASDKFAQVGVTCIHDNFCMPGLVKNYVQLTRSGKFAQRLRAYPYVANIEICRRVLEVRRPPNTDRFAIPGIKLAIDGYALMYDVPDDRKHLAIPMHPQDRFEAIIKEIHDAGLQADVHAVGDKGVDWTLQAFEKAAGSPDGVRKMRHRIEHFPFRKVDTIRRTAKLGVPVCSQPAMIDVRADDFIHDFTRLGKQGRQLVETMVPLRTFMKEKVVVCFGADVPAFPSYRPLDSIRCAMARKTPTGDKLDPAESVTFMEALKMHTINGAWAAFDEGKLGSLEAGKLADLAIWNKDLRKISGADDLKGLAVVGTWVSGKEIWSDSAAG